MITVVVVLAMQILSVTPFEVYKLRLYSRCICRDIKLIFNKIKIKIKICIWMKIGNSTGFKP